MTSPSPMHNSAVHIETDNTLTCTDDLTRLTNAHEQSRHNTLKPTWHDFSVVNFDICSFTCVIIVVFNTKFKLASFCTLVCYIGDHTDLVVQSKCCSNCGLHQVHLRITLIFTMPLVIGTLFHTATITLLIRVPPSEVSLRMVG